MGGRTILSSTGYEMEELIGVVAVLAEQYSGMDSTSIPYEKAQQLMEAVQYCIHKFESCGGEVPAVGKTPAGEAYRRGYQLVVEKVKDMMDRYHLLIEDFCSYGNVYLNDTILKGIPEFLKWYDAKYYPQNTILTMDYPVLVDLSSDCGIDAIAEYVKSIAIEQRFLGRFAKEDVVRFLKMYCVDYQELIENICSIVLFYVVCYLLMDKTLEEELTKEDYSQIGRMYETEGEEIMSERITDKIREFLETYYPKDEEIIRYIMPEADNIAVRMKNFACYGNLERQKEN